MMPARAGAKMMGIAGRPPCFYYHAVAVITLLRAPLSIKQFDDDRSADIVTLRQYLQNGRTWFFT
jgi:hypothetical protein